ncbi:MAG: tripartite tricarboxylate transporter substrate binding protein [Desulfobacterales bacterium]|nr:tripartite tricarboxylate transporter substrate binding protein [Desulfobacterales bacterium]
MKKMILMALCVSLTVLFTVNFGNTPIAFGEDAAGFYKDKVVTFMVPYNPGGGTDAFARMMAPFLGKYLDATIVVKNQPGAGGTYAYNHLYSKKPDGLTISITDSASLILASILDDKGVDYDFRKFNWLGRLSWSRRVILIAKDSPLRTLEDLMKADKIKIAGTGKTDATSMTLQLLFHSLNIPPEKVSTVLGYSGGKEAMMSVMQAETDMTSLTEDTSYGFTKGGLVKAYMTVDNERSKLFPETPAFYELTNPPEERDWPLAVFLDLQRLRRGVITSPNVPADRVAFLRTAIAKSLKDQKLLDIAAKKKRLIDPLTGDEMEALIKKKVGKLSDQQIAEFRDIALKKYQ